MLKPELTEKQAKLTASYLELHSLHLGRKNWCGIDKDGYLHDLTKDDYQEALEAFNLV